MPINKVYCGTSTTDDLLTAVNELIDQGASNLGNIQQLLTDLAALETQVGQLETELNTEVSRLDGDLSQLESDITASINILSSRVTDNDSDIAGLRSDTDANTAAINSNGSVIAGLRTDTDANTADINSNASDIAGLRADTDANTSAINSNTSDIAGLRTDTDDNTSAINSNASDIAGLRDDVDTLYPWAMRKVEFEAMRAANNEKYAASGFVHKGIGHSSGNINEGLWVSLSENILNLGRSGTVSGHVGNSKTPFPQVNIAGVFSKIEGISYSSSGLNRIKLPPAEDGTRTYDSATGVSITHATPALAFAAETATNKVVTDRVDMWGFEAFLREIDDADPFVYKNGLIQSLAPAINGVATVDDNVRPVTYFAWYEGDTTSRGKGVNWQTATEEQRIAIASDPKNNIYFDDATGKFYQWCIRGRSFAGRGNGDWHNLDSTKSDGNYLNFGLGNKSLILPQGVLDYNPPYTNSDAIYLAHNVKNIPAIKQGDLALFKVRNFTHEGVTYPSAVCSSGECYFLVCGTVNRLNKGAYHPSLNPLGADQWIEQGVTAGDWSASSSFGVDKPQCFYPAINTGEVGRRRRGDILTGDSGRPDGRLYDAIYASGQGGVCRDMRYSAWGLKAEDFAEQDLKIKSGKYRGRERLPFSVPLVVGGNSITSYISFGETKPDWWDDEVLNSGPTEDLGTSKIYIDNPATGERLFVWLAGYTTSSSIGWYLRTTKVEFANSVSQSDFHGLVGGEVLILQTTEEYSFSKVSVADEYTHTEVIGAPNEILLCDDLKDGWVGSWNSTIPDGTERGFKYQKPVTHNDFPKLFTSDNGASWGTGAASSGFNPITNTFTDDLPANMVAFISYQTKAKMTTDSENSEVDGGVNGVGCVFTSSYNTHDSGSLLGNSLLDKVLTGLTGAPYIASLPLTQNNIQAGGKLPTSQSWSMLSHNDILIPKPSTSDLAFKALNYNVVKNQQGFINYAYTELHYDTSAGDWGDDSKIHIADNQTTMLDENGHTVLVGTARIVEPLGWIKNDK